MIEYKVHTVMTKLNMFSNTKKIPQEINKDITAAIKLYVIDGYKLISTDSISLGSTGQIVVTNLYFEKENEVIKKINY